MSLDICLIRDSEVLWSGNLTHNMAEMANHLFIRCNAYRIPIRAYSYIWCPHELNIFDSVTILPHLGEIIRDMTLHHESLTKFNPKNEWGSYDVFLTFLVEYFIACKNNPGSRIEVSK